MNSAEGGAAENGGTSGTAFPRLEARNLNGRRHLLPDEFEGDLSIVLVAFEQWQQAQVDTWLPALGAVLAALSTRGQDPRLYELVVGPRLFLPARPLIDGAMARYIADPAVRARTLTAYVDVAGTVAALGLPDTRDIAILLVARGGQIQWRTRGAYDPQRVEALARFLDITDAR